MINYTFKLYIFFALLFNLCYAMDPNDSSILNEENITLTPNNIHPPLEVWEQNFNSLTENEINTIQNNICDVINTINLRSVDEVFNACKNDLPVEYIMIDCLEMFKLHCITHNYIEKNKYFYENYFDKINQLDLQNIKHASYFSEWKNAITINPFPEFEISKEVQNILNNKNHLRHNSAKSLYLFVYINWYRLCLLNKFHNFLYNEKYKNKPYIDKMLAAGYNKIGNNWKFIDNFKQIPNVDYYFLADYDDDCPDNWKDIFDEHDKLSYSNIDKEKFKCLLNTYHATPKTEENIPDLLKFIKDIKNYIDNCDIENPLSYEEDICFLETEKETWIKCLQKLEAINEEITPQEFKQNILLSLGEKLSYIQKKINIDINNAELSKIDEVYANVYDMCSYKYDKIINEINELKDKLNDNNAWYVFEDLKERLKQKKDYFKQISTLRKKANNYVQNFQTQLCKLLPFWSSSLKFIDPLNRDELLDKLIIWQELAKSNPDITNFYLWLESEPPLPLEKKRLSIDKTKVKFNNAIAYNSFWGYKSKPLCGVYLYVLAPDSSLYIANNSKSYEEKKYKHADISKEPFAIGAGQIIFENGKIIYINRQSGHYLPQEKHLANVIKSLKQKYTKNIFSNVITDNSLSTSVMFLDNKLFIKREIKEHISLYADDHMSQKKELNLFDLGFNN